MGNGTPLPVVFGPTCATSHGQVSTLAHATLETVERLQVHRHVHGAWFLRDRGLTARVLAREYYPRRMDSMNDQSRQRLRDCFWICLAQIAVAIVLRPFHNVPFIDDACYAWP